MRLTTDEELAEQFGLTVEQLHDLRVRKNWPCVKLGRSRVRFTDEQIAQIVAQQTEAPAASASKPAALTSVPGQTARSAARRKSARAG